MIGMQDIAFEVNKPRDNSCTNMSDHHKRIISFLPILVSWIHVHRQHPKRTIEITDSFNHKGPGNLSLSLSLPVMQRISSCWNTSLVFQSDIASNVARRIEASEIRNPSSNSKNPIICKNQQNHQDSKHTHDDDGRPMLFKHSLITYYKFKSSIDHTRN